ncbi:MAG: ABC transporter ATP-binding protein [Euryarchaeota archaeon]|nr:ABC transporter ATP-binding protein [Euryarchaeota archaeon]MDE1837469.1 ABC transporter ATP-binding protein [Euryarchaeota archaeon]MDE1881787.1 ABC transporter ATP-binding protein [Euryarchaeota archaeon]MDE2045565.1 ABC transporter ATP-binding protein [Thermoplasmata archaeon]
MATLPSSADPLVIEDLTVAYGSVTAVDGLSLRVRAGEIYGLLGSNGAGKTSTMKAIVGLVQPASGRIRVAGRDPVSEDMAVKEMVGYVPETALLYDALSPREFLEFVASVRRLRYDDYGSLVHELVGALQVGADMDRPLATLSNGTRQKLLLVAAFLHRPRLLVLDEPFNNLDPRSVRIMRDLLTAYVREGNRAALFSTHTVEVAERLCHRLAILDGGKLQGEGTLAELRTMIRRPEATLEDVYLGLTAEGEATTRAMELLRGKA